MTRGTIWHIAKDPHTHACGCAEWEQWNAKAQAWLPHAWRCPQHGG